MVDFKPTEQQLKAITHPPGPLMIIAGAGTGKTSTLVHRIQRMIETRVSRPENIIVLTFTERATEELAQKIRLQAGKVADEVSVSTFHAFCNRLVREYSSSPDAEKLLLQENDITYLLLSRFDEFTFLTSWQFRADPASAVMDSFVPFFNRIRDELFTSDEVAKKFEQTTLTGQSVAELFPGLSEKTGPDEYVRQFNDLVKVYETYQSWKQELGVVDYADMILDCWEMLRGNPKVLEQVRRRYRHIIIDEYQDNNFALNRIVNLIACPPTPSADTGRLADGKASITVVGDEDQCIYSFRGANYYNVQDFRQRYGGKAGYGEVKLEENHRSTQEILDLANASIAHDKNRTPKVLVSAKKRHGTKPIWHVGSRLQTLTKIPELIHEYVAKKGRSYGDMGVICRTWNQVKAVAEALQEASIPVDVFVERFFSVPAVKDILAWGHLLFNTTKTEAALFRVLGEHLGRDEAEAFFRQNEAGGPSQRLEELESYASAKNLTSEKETSLKWILEAVNKLRRQADQKRPADEMIWDILATTDLLESVRHSYRYAERLALANVGRLISLAESFATRESEKTLERWLEYMEVMALDINLPAVQPMLHDSTAAVQVMTIHGCKGLEFPIVMIPFLHSSSFPIRYATPTRISAIPDDWYNWPRPANITPKDEHINEERRIFYVAITRAKDELHLFAPEKSQSVFMRELLSIPEALMERRDMNEIQPTLDEDEKSVLKQKLLVELNRELSANQYETAHDLIEGLRSIEQEGRLSNDHPYAYLMRHVKAEARRVVEGQDVLHLSASSIEEYDRCPYKYRLNKIDKVPERKSTAQMGFGIIIHKVLEEFHGSKDQSLEYLTSLLEKHWRREAFDYLLREEEFKRQGKEVLQDYWEYVRSNPPEVVALEAQFDFRIDEIGVRVTGKIDRIDREGESLSVTDYKTSKNKERARSSLQLALYAEALRRHAVEGVEGTPGSARLHFLRHPDEPVDSHTFSSQDLRKHLQRVEKVADGIRKGEFEPRADNFKCRTCDYKAFLCPAWEDK